MAARRHSTPARTACSSRHRVSIPTYDLIPEMSAVKVKDELR